MPMHGFRPSRRKNCFPVNSYSLSIPTLELLNATVVISGDDLSKKSHSLWRHVASWRVRQRSYFRTLNIASIFKGTKEYKSIFSTLPLIKIGDDVIITFDGISYTYRVFDKVVVDPNDLSPLEQHFDDSYITIVTCVPPGTYLYRLNVKAKLVRI